MYIKQHQGASIHIIHPQTVSEIFGGAKNEPSVPVMYLV